MVGMSANQGSGKLELNESQKSLKTTLNLGSQVLRCHDFSCADSVKTRQMRQKRTLPNEAKAGNRRTRPHPLLALKSS